MEGTYEIPQMQKWALVGYRSYLWLIENAVTKAQMKLPRYDLKNVTG